MSRQYGYTVLGISKSEWDEAEEKPVALPANFTISWNDDESDGFISGTGYGVGQEFTSAESLREYTQSHGWAVSTEV